jgi:hypothetical protein
VGLALSVLLTFLQRGKEMMLFQIS